MIELRSSQKILIPRDQQLFVQVLAEKNLGTIQGTVETFPLVERRHWLSPALAQITEIKSFVQITNFTSLTILLDPNTTVAILNSLTPNEAERFNRSQTNNSPSSPTNVVTN